jgi:WD40 repeat protein
LAKDLEAPDSDEIAAPPEEDEVVDGAGATVPGKRAAGSAPRRPPATGSGGLTVAGSVMGTPGYMPPEQASGADVDERADVYALGAILYHLLGGGEPYATTSQTLEEVLAGPPRRLGELEPELPHDLVTIIEKAMAREREARYRTAVELAEDLRRFQTGQLVVAHRYSRRELVIRFIGRHRTTFTAALVALIAGAAILAFSFRRIVRERDRAEQASEHAARRADELVIARAASLLDSDPRQALAALAGLSGDAPPPLWRRARMVASDARLRGIPTTLRGHGAPVGGLDLSRDGDLLVSADDHAVWVWDVASGRGREIARQQSPIVSVKVSADGKRVATSAIDGAIRIWFTAGGWGTQLSGHESLVHPVELLEDGRLLSYSMDGTIRAWQIDAGSHDLIGKHATGIVAGALSRDGSTFASVAEDRVVHVWPTRPGGTPVLLRGPTETVRILAIAPDGSRVAAAGSFDSIWLWQVASGASRELTGHDDDGVRAVVFSPDGKRLASAGKDHTIRIWDLASGKAEILRGHEDAVFGLEFDRTGAQLTSSSRDGTVRVWSVAGAKSAGATQVLGGHGEEFTAAISEDGRTLVTTSGSIIRRWQAGAVGTALRGHRGGVVAVEMAPSGRYLASAGADWTVRIWPLGDRDPPRVLSGHDGNIRALEISPDSALIATVDQWHRIWLWSPDGKVARELEGHAFGEPVFAPSGTVIAAPSVGHAVRLWNTRTGESRLLRGHRQWVISVAFSPDGRQLASGATDGAVRLWSFPDGGEREVSGHTDPVRYLAFAGPGRLISADLRGVIREYEIASEAGRELARAAGDRVTGFAVSASGDQVAWVDGEGDVQLWSRRAGQARALERGDRSIHALAFSRDGRTLLGHSESEHVLVWDTATGAAMTLRSYGRTVNDAAISPSGLLVATAESDGTVRLWPFDLPYQPARLREWLRATTAE